MYAEQVEHKTVEEILAEAYMPFVREAVVKALDEAIFFGHWNDGNEPATKRKRRVR